MKRQAMAAGAALALLLVAGGLSAYGQTVFKIPFDFQAAGKKLPKGDYSVVLKGEAQVLLRQASTGQEVSVPVLKKIEKPKPPLAEPQLVFDEVGDFAPSYTEYLTVYILSEVWLPGQDGAEVHVTRGAHQNKTIKAEKGK